MKMNNDWLDNLEKELNQINKTEQVHLSVTLLTSAVGDEHRIVFQGYDKDLNFSEMTYNVDCKIFLSSFEYLNTLAAALEIDKRTKGGN
jgi:hypothetical protein